MSARVLVIGLDSVSATFLDRWADAGDLPHFAALRRRASQFQLDAECMETLPGAIWTDIAYGTPGAKQGQFYHFEQYQPTEGVCRPLHEEEIDARGTIWSVASAAGRRCAVVDVPFMPLFADFNGVQLRDLAVHDIWMGAASRPVELIDEIYARYGEPPLHRFMCDKHVSRDGRRTLFEQLLARSDIKTKVLRDLMSREPWDLFLAVYGDAHCASHQLWPTRKNGKLISIIEGFDDPWGAVRRVYARIDEGLGTLIADAGPDAHILIFTSHSMGFYLGGPQLLPEVLRRLGLSGGYDWPGRRALRNLAFRLRGQIQVGAIEEVGAFHTSRAQRLRHLLGIERYPAHSSRCRAFTVPNNRIGAIRLKIAGRDHGGSLTPEDAGPLLSEISRELRALTDPQTGLPLVRRVECADDRLGSDRSPLTPDLLVKFRTDLGNIERAYSHRLGTIHVPNRRPAYERSGDHVPQSRAWIIAPTYPAGARYTRRNVLDLAPTILSFLDVEPHSHMVGKVLRPDREAAMVEY